MSDDPYVWPGTAVLRNKLGISDEDELDYRERELVSMRRREGIPAGRFDLKHLRAIHRQLFQDVYDWAGELRTVEISRGGSQFQLRRFMEVGMADVHRRLVAADFLRRLEPDAFVRQAAEIIGDVNYVHPFRDGNGRTQLLYLDQLAEQAGHPLDLTRLTRDRWIPACQAAHQGRHAELAVTLLDALG